MAAITLDIGGNTSRLDRDIQKTVNKVYTINLKTKGEQPLGRITGQVNEFNKSLDASNARVIAFGASAGVIFGVQRAFEALVSSTINVQKSLQDINVILNASKEELNKFGSELFGIAKNTGQSFDEVAKAATEFSRQGLGIAETLKRTNEALILSRLSGLDAAKSVEALTAAVNSFASQAVTATEVVNKFATVDAAFAVSSADLADAISRVGSSAAQSGVSLDELIAIVTSAQQTTARGGAVIGNSFKTIFTRLQREKVVDLLESLGISSTDATGQVKSTIQLLSELGKVYDTLGSQQQAYVAEQVGGVFQINILKAALSDLGKQYSIYSSALNTSAGSTDQAIKRNEELNKTYAAQLNALQQNATQIAAIAGERVLGPAFDRVVGGANKILGGITDADANGFGAILGKGILDGLGQFIAGPGLALIGGVLLKLFKNLGTFATGSFKELLGLNQAATQQRDLQQSISQILSKNPQLLQLALQGEQGLNQAANSLLASLQKQTVELQKQAAVASQISKAFYGAGVRLSGGIPTVPTGKPGKATGYIPNFAKDDFAREELLASVLGAKNPTAQLSKGTIDGRKFIKNNREVEITNFGRNGDSAVIPTYAKGFIPNFAKTKLPKNISLDDAIKRNLYSRSQLSQRFGAKAINEKLGSAKKAPKDNIFASRLIGTRLPTILTPSGGGRVASKTQKGVGPNGENVVWNFPVRNANRGPLKESIEDTFGSGNFIDQWINNNLIGISSQIATAMGVQPARPGKFSEVKNAKGFKGAISSTLGTIFDSAITTSLDIAAQKDGGDFDIRGGENVRKPIAKLFGENALSKGKSGQWLGDIKISSGPDAVDSMIAKTRKEWSNIFAGASKKKLAFSGFIPNFAAIQDAVARERAAGIPSSQIYLAQEKALTSANPMGLGVFNTSDEPTAGARSKAIKNRGYATGYIPNFAEESPSSVTSTILALGTELAGVAFLLKGSSAEYTTSLEQLTQINLKAAKEKVVAAEKELLASKELLNASRQELAASKNKTQANIANQNIQYAQREVITAQGNLSTAQKEVKTAKGGFKQRLTAAGSAYGGALSIAAPILAQTAKNFIPADMGKTGRGISAGIDVASQVGSMAAMGSMFGPIGTAVGAAAGALMSVPNLVDQMSTDFPELSAAAQAADQALTKFNDSASKLQSATENLASVIADSKSSPEKVKKAQDAYAAALGEFSVEEQKRITEAEKAGTGRQEMEKLRGEKERTKESTQLTANLGEIAGKSASKDFWGDLSSGLLKTTVAGGITDKIQEQFTGVNLVDQLTQTVGAQQGSAELKTLQGSFLGQLLQGKQGQDALDVLQKTRKNEAFKGLSNLEFGNTEGLTDALTSLGLKTKDVEQIVQYASTNQETFKNVTIGLSQAVLGATDQTMKANKAAEEQTKRQREKEAADKREAESKKRAIEATQGIIDALQRNIDAAQEAAAAERERNAVFSQYAREQAFADTFTRPRETVSKIVGENAPLAQKFALREEIGNIFKTQQEGRININKNIIDGITNALDEGFNEAVKIKAPETEGKTSKDIRDFNTQTLKPQTANIQSAFNNIQKILTQNLTGGASNQQAILDQIKNELVKSNIDEKSREKILQQAKDEFKKGNIGIEKLKAESLVAFKTLAKEQTQKILIQKIGQAQAFGGGINSFLNPPDEFSEDTSPFGNIKKAAEDFTQYDLKDRRFEYAPGTNKFKYQNPESKKAREEMAPEFGRSALKLIGSLQEFTGYTPDTQGKAYQASVAGVKVFYDKQIAELQKIAKTTSDPMVAEEINAALREVSKLGGTETIAKLQVAQKTGALDEAQYRTITQQFKDPVLEQFRQQAMSIGNQDVQNMLLKELDDMAKNSLVSQDPTVNAINKSNDYLAGILEKIGGQTSEQKLEEKFKIALSGGNLSAIESKNKTTTPTIGNEVNNSNQILITSINTLIDTLKQQSIPTTQTQTGGAVAQTTTNAPVNVVVNAQGSNDIAKAVGDAVQNAIPTIIDKVKVALGQKVPPKSSGVDMNKK